MSAAMKKLRRALRRPPYEALGRGPFGQLVDRSALSIKAYETGATPTPIEVLQRCRQIALDGGWKDIAAELDQEIAGEPATSSGDETAAAIRELSAKIEQLAKGLGVRLPPTSNRGKK